MRPSYYTRGALKARGGYRASIGHTSIGHASILLHTWSPKNEGWVQSVHRPRVHLITCVEPSKQGVGAERPLPTRPLATRPSYYTHGALKTGVWVQSVHRVGGGGAGGVVKKKLCSIISLIYHLTSPKLYRSYDPHQSRDSMSPVCGIFFIWITLGVSACLQPPKLYPFLLGQTL